MTQYASDAFHIKKIKILFEIKDTSKIKIKSNIIFSKKSANANHIELQGENIIIKTIKLNQKSIIDKIKRTTKKITIDLKNYTNDIELAIENEIMPNKEQEGIFMHNNNIYSQCETKNFRKITYFLDNPDIVTKYLVTIRGNKQDFPYMLSNGNLIEHKDLTKDHHEVTWSDPWLKPSYLFALVAGKFAVTTDYFIKKNNKKTNIQIFTDNHNKQKTKVVIEAIKKAMQWDEDNFGFIYDLDFYNIVAIDAIEIKAMENKGLNIFNAEYILIDKDQATYKEIETVEAIIAHEYFHNWTGNRVTCKDWMQLSLKEGLNKFRENLFTARADSLASRIKTIKAIKRYQAPEDISDNSHPVIPINIQNINNMYTPTIYYKGTEIIRMLYIMFGEAKFKILVQEFVAKFDQTPSTCEDLMQIAEQVFKADLKQFRLWYYQSGTPVINWKKQYNQEQQELTLTISQKQEPTKDQAEKQSLHIPLEVRFINSKSETQVQSQHIQENIINITKETETISLKKIPEEPIVTFLGSMSAPVKMAEEHSPAELISITAKSKNEFTVWNAVQAAYLDSIKQLILKQKQKQKITTDNINTEYIQAIKNRFINEKNKNLMREMLTIPSYKEIYDAVQIIHPQHIHEARKILNQSISKHMFQELYDQYQINKKEQTVAAIKLNNKILEHLALNLDATKPILIEQYYKNKGINKKMGALIAVNFKQNSIRDELIRDFKTQCIKGKQDIKKWFYLEANINSNNTINNINKIIQDPIFDIKNKLHTESLIRTFGEKNKNILHQVNGDGYKLIAQTVIRIQHFNTELATEILDTIVRWKNYQEEYLETIKTIFITEIINKKINQAVFNKAKKIII